MVRLIQGFLRWLRELLSQTSKANDKYRQPLPPSKQLPAVPSTPNNTVASPPPPPPPRQVRDFLKTTQLPSEKIQSDSSLIPIEQQPDSRQPTATDSLVDNSSSFQVLLQNYRYSPSPAVQELNQQLSQADIQAPSVEPMRLKAETVTFDVTPLSSPQPPSFEETVAPTPELKHPAVENPPEESLQDPSQQSQIGPVALTESDESLSPTPPQSTALPILKPVVSHRSPGTITTQGFVKLLFKLKRSNYHGYITPNDGSKDIIFHQKYIGDDIFFRLERGMEVEVTAHITEGKAYADSVRILQ